VDALFNSAPRRARFFRRREELRRSSQPHQADHPEFTAQSDGWRAHQKRHSPIADAIGDRNIMILSDEIYSRLIYEGEDFSIASVPASERTIILMASRKPTP